MSVLLEIMIICFTVPEIWCVMNIIAIFHFGLFFDLHPTSSLKNQNERKKNEKKPLEISSFYKSVPKIMNICYAVPET